MDTNVQAQFEQLGDWSDFSFSIPKDAIMSKEFKDECGNYIIDKFSLTKDKLSFEKKYLRGTTHFADCVSHDFSYTILYDMIMIKENEYAGTWRNIDVCGFGNSGKARAKIV